MGACLLVAALAGATPAAAIIQGGGCVNDVSGLSNNCTANDLTFVAVGLGIQDDGCVSASDTVSIFLRAQIANTTAQTRYDVGMYFATDGDPNLDGALSGVCSREILKPANTTTGATDCPPLDLTGGTGPFLDADGDTCADLLAEGNPGTCTAQGRLDTHGNPLRDAAIFDLSEAVTFPCRDVEPTPTGFVNIPLCGTWGNSADQVGGLTCDSETEAVPGTKSKCRCEDLDSNIPAPKLSLSCSCASPTTVRPGFPVTCTVSYANAATCTPDASTAERFQCGAASFVRFDLDDNRSGAEAGTFAVSDPGRGSTSGTPSGIVWTPRSTPENTLGIVGQGESDSLDFVYTVSPSATDGPVSITTQTVWSNSSSFTDPRVQTLSADCDITVDATYAAVSSFTAHAEGGQVAVEWATASENGTLGFDLYRRDGMRWVRVNERMLPAVGELPGASYRLLDPGAATGGGANPDRVTYKLVEHDLWGHRQTFGPYTVPVERPGAARRLDRGIASTGSGSGFESRPRRLPQPDFERLAEARRERDEQTASPARAALASTGGAASTASAAPARARIEIADTGLVRVTSADLAAAWGTSIAETEKTIRQGKVRVTGRGVEIGWQPTAADDGILLYGEAIDSLFTRTSAYFVEDDRGPQMPVVRLESAVGKKDTASPGATSDGGFTTTTHFEQDLLARPVVAESPNEDYWFWAGLIAGHPTLGHRSFALDVAAPVEGAAAAGRDAVLTVRLRGQVTDLSAIDDRAEVRLDGLSLGEAAWEGLRDHDASFTLPQSQLAGTEHTVELVAVKGSFFVDSFDLTYRRRLEATDGSLSFGAEGWSSIEVGGFAVPAISLFQITDPGAVQRLDGATVEPASDGSGYRLSFAPPDPEGRYLAVEDAATESPVEVATDRPSDLHDPANGADDLIIAPSAWVAAAGDLADYRRGRGLEVRVVDLQDIYDEFDHGFADPEAIRSFLAYAWASWERAPRYVTLVGKGSYDYRGLLGQEGNLMPPRMVASRNGLVPSDSSYAVFDGSPLPRMAVGRLPVVSASELSALTDKIAAYEASGGGAGGTWTERALLVADNPDAAGDFPADGDALAAALPSRTAVGKIYLGRPLSIAEARSALVADLREGARLVGYVGHGGFDRMAAEGILLRTDVPSLANERLPVVAALTCNLGMFAFPGFTSLGEALVIEPHGGAAAVWGPMGLSLDAEATALGHELLPDLAVEGTGEGDRLGDRILGALASHLAAGGSPDLVRIYGLLGDPALEMP